MSLDKAIRYGKEHRRPYRGAKSVDVYCRNHGGCPHCYGNRMNKNVKREIRLNYEIQALKNWQFEAAIS